MKWTHQHRFLSTIRDKSDTSIDTKHKFNPGPCSMEVQLLCCGYQWHFKSTYLLSSSSQQHRCHNRLNRLSKDSTFSRPGLRFSDLLPPGRKKEAFKQIYWLCKSNSRPFFGGKTNISNRNLFPGDEITGRRFVKVITLQKVFSSFTKRASFFADHVFGAFFAAPSKVFFLFCLENLKLLLFSNLEHTFFSTTHLGFSGTSFQFMSPTTGAFRWAQGQLTPCLESV